MNSRSYSCARSFLSLSFGRKAKKTFQIWIGLFLLTLVSTFGIAKAQQLYYYNYKPVSPRTNVTDWTNDCGASEQLSAALQAFEREPTVTKAIDIFHLRKELSTSDQLRNALIQKDPKLCLAIELAQYEIVAHTNLALGAKKSLRMGSSGARQMEILEWIRSGAHEEKIPIPEPQKWCHSDDDVMNLVDTGSVFQSLDANERVNGGPARDAFIRVTREVFGNALDPEEVETNFLSPTKAWPILQEKYNLPNTWPKYLYAWTAQNEEKYNWVWGLSELERWGWDKGCETADVGDPIGTTDYLRNLRERPGDPPPSGRLAFIANNYRLIYYVHSGDFFYKCKYLTRMILAWKERLGDRADAALPENWERAFDRALAVYMNGADSSGAEELSTEVSQIIDKVLFTTHEYHLERVSRSILDALRTARPGPGKSVSFEELLRKHPALADDLDGLIVAYSNIPSNLHEKLMEQFAEKIRNNEESQDGVSLLENEILKRALEVVQEESGFQRDQIEAFRRIRGRVEANLAHCLEGTDLEDFLRKVGKGEFSAEELRLVDWRIHRVKRQLTPEEVDREILFIKSVSVLFGWDQAEAATRLKEYFEQGPSTALSMMRRIYDVFDTSRHRPIHVEYTDASGVARRTTIKPSGESLGYRCFKAALYGYDIYGKVSSGREIFNSVYQIYGRGGVSDEEAGILQAQAFMAMFDIYELIRSDLMGVEVAQLPMSGTLSQIAVGTPGAALAGDRQATELLLKAAIKDALLLWNPGLATAFVLFDLGSWAYAEHSLRSVKSDVIEAMVQNGIWALKGPRDSSVPLSIEQMKELSVGDEDGLQLLSVRLSKNGTQIRKIMLAREETTIELAETGQTVEPRISLKELAYLKGYLDSDPVVRASIDAVENLNSASNWFTAEALPRDSADWTWDNLADAGVVVNRREDQISPISARDVSFAPHFEGTSAWGIDLQDQELRQSIFGNQRRLLGFLIMDFWVKQQRLLQEYLLPAMEKEAARRLIEKIKNEMTEVAFTQEIEEIDSALKELDRNLWPRIANSADPFPGREFDPNLDFPVYDSFRQSTQWVRNSLNRYQRFLEDPTQTQLWDDTWTPSYQGSSHLDRKQVTEKGKELLQYMRDIYHLLKDGYDEVHGYLDRGKRLVAKTGDIVLEPFHVKLEPGTFSPLAILTEGITPARGDLARTKNWYAAFLDQRERVAKDIQERNRTVKAPGSLAETGWVLLSGDADPAGSSSHPLWPTLTRLRYQIQKLTYMQDCLTQITPAELEEHLRRMTIQEGEWVQVDSGNLQNPGAFLSSTTARMEQEYQRLLDQLDRLFEIQITAESLGRDPFIGEELTFQAQIVTEDADVKTGFPDFVTGFEWAIRTEEQNTVGEPIVTKLPELNIYFPRAGRHFIWVRAVDAGENTLAFDILPVRPQPLSLVGTVELEEGEYQDELVTVTAAGSVRGDLSTLGDFSFEVGMYNPQDWREDDAVYAELVTDQSSITSTTSAVTAMPADGLLRVDNPLRFSLPAGGFSLDELYRILDQLRLISERINELSAEATTRCGVARQTIGETEAVLDALYQRHQDAVDLQKKMDELSLRVTELEQQAKSLDAKSLAAAQAIRGHWSRANQIAQAGCERVPAIQSAQNEQERQGLLSEIRATVSACAAESHQADAKQTEIEAHFEMLTSLLEETSSLLAEMTVPEGASQVPEAEIERIQGLLASVTKPVSDARACLDSISELVRNARTTVAEIQNREEALPQNTELNLITGQIDALLQAIETSAADVDRCPEEISLRTTSCEERLSEIRESLQSGLDGTTQTSAGSQYSEIIQQVQAGLKSSEASLAVAEEHTSDIRRAVEDLALCFSIGEDLLEQSNSSDDPSREEQLAQADCSMYPGTHAVWNEQENRPGCACLPGLVENSSRNGCIDCGQYWNAFQSSLQSGNKARAEAVLSESTACPWFQQGQAMINQQANQESRCNQLLEAFYGAMRGKLLNEAQNILSQAQDCSFYSEAAAILRTEFCSQIQQSILSAIQSNNVEAANSFLNQARAMRCRLAPEAISLVQNAVYRKQQRERDQERIKKWDYQLKLLEELTQISGQSRPPTQLPTPPATRSETPVGKNIPTLSELNDTNYRKQCVGYVYYRHKMYKGEPDTEPHLFEWYNWTDYRFTTVHPLPCRVPEWEFGDECKKVRFCTGKMERIK